MTAICSTSFCYFACHVKTLKTRIVTFHLQSAHMSFGKGKKKKHDKKLFERLENPISTTNL